MTDEAIVDIWARLKPFISKVDRVAAADAFVSILDDHGLIDATEHSVVSIGDRTLKDAIIAYFELDEDLGDEYDD